MPEAHRGSSGRLQGQVALVIGGDSGIGRATAIAFAKEGADVAIAFLDECDDASRARQAIEACGRRAIAIAGDLGDEATCRQTVQRVVDELGRLDVLVNNAAEQHFQQSLADISAGQFERTFRPNVFAMFFCTKAALPHLKGHRGLVLHHRPGDPSEWRADRQWLSQGIPIAKVKWRFPRAD